ncbi:hypothetical protein [Maribellus maritimus]|uniref:hypothetical protein n=1 Tax=Maribellus maritimus TaxID=2870838 RepID=UPI001EECA00D|nr:hypothetical protein [Maribellus maritimus]MCG6186557.1 hypothetical protein [Maribellus maritimus]
MNSKQYILFFSSFIQIFYPFPPIPYPNSENRLPGWVGELLARVNMLLVPVNTGDRGSGMSLVSAKNNCRKLKVPAGYGRVSVL